MQPKLHVWAKGEEGAVGMFNGSAVDGDKDRQQTRPS